MNLSEVLTGATALSMAMLVAHGQAQSTRALPSVTSPAAEKASPAMELSPPAPPFTYGRARMIHAPTPCDVPTFSEGGPGAPYFVADGVPRAGRRAR